MKTPLLLIFIAAVSSASGTVAIGSPSYSPTAENSISGAVLERPTAVAQRAHGKQMTRPQANLTGFRGTVVKEMRATKAFVKKNVVKEQSADSWLMLLAAIGMIVLQLRRKHNSLPQRQIAPYA
jgi:hypothetical protein